MSDTIRVLVTTDNHVGYNESDPVRGADSANTFLEIMELAVEHDVDMILQAGDLFHYNSPSRESMYNVIRAIRKTCLGDKPVQLEMLNHGVFDMEGEEFNHVNYEDPNLNVAIPMFAISGNHDDAGGAAMLSAMDVLASTGLINHFGRVFNHQQIQVEPVLMRKGQTKLALYGMASVREERLKRAFKQGQVKFKRPPNSDEWYNLLALHQNHAVHDNRNNYVPETVVPNFIDTAIWGHEHECKIDPSLNDQNMVNFVQPGSSVATSLSEGEAVPKHVTIMSITGKQAEFEKISLKTVRPFMMEHLVLENEAELTGHNNSKGKAKVNNLMTKRVNALIDQAKQEWTDQHPGNDEVPLPLVRLHVDYSGGFEVENATRFSNKFRGLVANESDVVIYARQKKVINRKKNTSGDVHMEEETTVEADELVLNEGMVEQLVGDYLGEKKLHSLLEASLGGVVKEFVQGATKGSFKGFVDHAISQNFENLRLHNIKDQGDPDFEKVLMEGKALQEGYQPPKKAKRANDDGEEDEDEDEEVGNADYETTNSKAKKAPAKRASAKKAAEPAKAKAPAKKAAVKPAAKPKEPAAPKRPQRVAAKPKAKQQEEVVISDDEEIDSDGFEG